MSLQIAVAGIAVTEPPRTATENLDFSCPVCESDLDV